MRTFKRLLSLALCVMMVFTMIPAVANANEEPVYAPIEFTVTSAKGVANKTVHVEVRVSENSQIASMGLELNFDSGKLLVDNFTAGDLLANGLSAINANISDKVILSFATMEPLTEAGMLFSVDFDVTTTDINDIVDMYVTVTEITDINGDDLTATAKPGTVEVVDLLYGDVNSDNRITAVDALMVLSNATEEIQLSEHEAKAGDVNGDGEVSVSDALQILYFSAEIISDFRIYNLEAPKNLRTTGLDGYQFTVSWDYCKDVLGYYVYMDGELMNSELLTENRISIGVDMNGNYGSSLIPNRIHDTIEQVTTYNIEVTAVNALKESDKCEPLSVTTKRIWSWVTFNDWDGTLIKKARVYYGDDAVVPADPTREDYFFTGWDKPTTNITDDTVITATYEDAHYDFIFLNEDGTELYRQDVTVNGKATPPADPVKAGHTFSGWFTAPSGGTKVEDFTITSATGARTVYAQYTVNSYKVTFQTNGGSAVSAKTAVYKTATTEPTAPTKLGFGFGGWYKDAKCTNRWNFATDVITADTTLYAKWNPVVITIDKPEVTLESVGATAKLTATVTGGTDSITWTSENPNVATIDANGQITAVGHGTTTIYVKGAASERRPVTVVKVDISWDAWIVKNNVRILSNPSGNSGAVSSKTLSIRDKITVFGKVIGADSSGKNGWYYIKSGDIYGYVEADCVDTKEPSIVQPTDSFNEKVEKLKALYPAGYPWGNDVYISYHNGKYGSGFVGGSSCYAFAIVAYIEVNGHAPRKIDGNDYSQIQVGDVIHFWDKWSGEYGHWAFVTKVDANGVWCAEGNYNLKVIYNNYRRFESDMLYGLSEIRR